MYLAQTTTSKLVKFSMSNRSKMAMTAVCYYAEIRPSQKVILLCYKNYSNNSDHFPREINSISRPTVKIIT